MKAMLSKIKSMRKPLFWLLILVLLLTACSNNSIPAIEETSLPNLPTSTSVPEQPTPTLTPAAAIVNGERIPLNWFENEVDRYFQAMASMDQPVEDESIAREIVLNDLIDQVLLAQGAREAGALVSDEDVQARIDILFEEVDLAAWMAEWGYSEDDLFQSLKLQMLAADQRDRIAETVPELVEQVELQQVLTYTEDGANTALRRLNAGEPFIEVAFTYQSETGGYLGWVPRGYLLIEAVEQAAFDLPVGSYSAIIESDIGFHIVLVIDRGEYPLTADARIVLQRQSLQSWLAEQREKSTFEVLVD